MMEIATKEEVIREAPSARIGASFFIRVALTAIALIIWFWSQKLIGNRGAPAMAIGDRLQDLTAPVNLYLHAHASAADLLLIVSSGIIDLLGIFLLARWIFGASLRPFLGLVIVLGLRQIIQSVVALPTPPNSIWHYPGFPSLLVTYSVSNDYFFSGHTAIAVLAVTEIARLGKRWLTALGILLAIFEIATVLVLRAHYTMDVFTGIVTGLYAAYLAGWISAALNRLRIGGEV
jgi:hypothetical protein